MQQAQLSFAIQHNHVRSQRNKGDAYVCHEPSGFN